MKCHACLSLVCVFCARLKTEHGHERIKAQHCERHCRHKDKRSKLTTVEGFDRRGDRGR